jgi:nifR3 family TIM-barrel protein
MDLTPNFHHPVRLGHGVELRGNLFFAPLAGYSDAAFRSVCIEEGADFCFTEMVSAEALTRGHPKTKSLLVRAENETSYAIQLFGAKPAVLAKAAELVMPFSPTVIDLNCGCPVPKIVKSGAGSALIRNPRLIGEIVRAMVAALGPGIPVTVKIRSGWDESSINYLETAAEAVGAGAAAVTLHARTRVQGYAGKADWSHIAALVKALPVPVFGSGDVFKPGDARRMIEETGCAGVMVARGAMGNPFAFGASLAAMEGREAAEPGAQRKAELARRHLALSARFIGEKSACLEFRKQFCSYTKGTEAGAALRADAVKASSLAEFDVLFDRWLALA